MIELVLHDPAEAVIEIVVLRRLARSSFPEPGIRESRYSIYQLVVSGLQLLDSLAPRCRTGVGHGREILLVAQPCGLAPATSQHSAIPCGDVQNQLPDAMGILNRTSRGCLG